MRHSMHATILYGMCSPTDESQRTWYPHDFPCRVSSFQGVSFPCIYASSDGIVTLSKSPEEDMGLNPPLPPKQRDQVGTTN